MRAFVVCCLLFSQTLFAQDLSFLDKRFTESNKTALLVASESGEALLEKDAQQALIPASTTKLLTAFFALKHWGENHRFETHFYVKPETDAKQSLIVKGLGDPYLVSEELAIIAKQLSKKLASRSFENLILDTSFYQDNVILPGTGFSNNPYDAIPSALAANFNTVYLKRSKDQLLSAEAQTPLTKTAVKLAQGMNEKKLRFNTGRKAKTAQRYFAELLIAFLKKEGVHFQKGVVWQKTPQHLATVYIHKNSKTLAEMIRPMMKYSTNFIANQIALNLSVEVKNRPADHQTLKETYQELIRKYFNWQQVLIEDGAGLSGKNRLNSNNLIELLQQFRGWKHLLPEVEKNVFAKSGSLIGVSTLAGYMRQGEHWPAFVILMNQKTPYRYRNKVAKQVYNALSKND